MGIIDKIKGIFKKKDAGEKKAAKPDAKSNARPSAKAKPALDFSGNSLEKELVYAAEKIDQAVAAGKYDDARGDAFRAQLVAIRDSTASDDDRRIQLSRVIGGIINGI